VLRKEPDAAEVAADTRTREEGRMTPEQAEQLRAKFPPETIGKLPKPYKKDSAKGNCQECGGYHGLPAMHLDYVGHAAVTDRLLQVDPEWTWEPLAQHEDGVPAVDRAGNLWIRLTVGGVTRIGVGDGANAKECISDAIRNAAMRFGVALDLWAKEDLDALHQDSAAPRPTAGPTPPASGGDAQPSPPLPSSFTDMDVEKLLLLVEERGGDVAKTRAAAETAKAQDKLDTWFPLARKHWEAQPVATEFAKKAADAIAGRAA
jgi:hypothetical protein